VDPSIKGCTVNNSEEYYESLIAHLGGALGQIWEVSMDVKQDILKEEEAMVLIRKIAEWGMDIKHPLLPPEEETA
jgi:hypothetical protein